MKNQCEKCGDNAGFETSPEGQCCGICNKWVCDNCTDYKVVLKKLVLPNGKEINEDIICKDCSQVLKLTEVESLKNIN